MIIIGKSILKNHYLDYLKINERKLFASFESKVLKIVSDQKTLKIFPIPRVKRVLSAARYSICQTVTDGEEKAKNHCLYGAWHT